MSILVIAQSGATAVFNSIREFASVSREFVSQHGSIIEIKMDYSGYASAGVCPECGSPLAFEEGCRKCHACGFSACG